MLEKKALNIVSLVEDKLGYSRGALLAYRSNTTPVGDIVGHQNGEVIFNSKSPAFRRVMMARWCLFYLLRERGMTWPRIGRLLGLNHTSVIHGFEQFNKICETDAFWSNFRKEALQAIDAGEKADRQKAKPSKEDVAVVAALTARARAETAVEEVKPVGKVVRDICWSDAYSDRGGTPASYFEQQNARFVEAMERAIREEREGKKP